MVEEVRSSEDSAAGGGGGWGKIDNFGAFVGFPPFQRLAATPKPKTLDS